MHPRGLGDFGISLVLILYLTKMSMLFHNINAFASSPSLVDTVVRRHIRVNEEGRKRELRYNDGFAPASFVLAAVAAIVDHVQSPESNAGRQRERD